MDAPPVNLRRAQITRKTSETNLSADWNLDGRGDSEIATGLPFFDHMLTLFARHSLTDLRLGRRATSRSTRTTPSRTPALPWARR